MAESPDNTNLPGDPEHAENPIAAGDFDERAPHNSQSRDRKEAVPANVFTSRTMGDEPRVTVESDKPHRCYARPASFGLCALLLVSVVGLTLPRYGYTFDEVLGALLKGECILAYWSHGADAQYLNTDANRMNYYDDATHPDFYRGARVHQLWQFYALPNFASALTCRLFRSTILPIDAHHLAIVLVALIGLWYIYRTGWEEAGPIAAIAAFGIIVLHPRFFAHLHNDLKDVCVAMLMAATILTFRRATMSQSLRTLLWAGVLTALAVASKLNAIFIPVIGLPWFVCWLAFNRRQIRRRWVIGFLFVPLVALGVWCLLDPMFVHAPSQLGDFYRFYKEVAGGGTPRWNWFGLKKFLACTPPVFLAFFVVGLGWLAWKRRGYDLLLYGWWFALPILRVCVPNAKDCDGIRHYLECLPPFAIVAALGMTAVAGGIARQFGNRTARGVTIAAAFAVLFGPALYVNWLYHPYQTVYYNSFVGGFRGARDDGLRDGDYWCTSYRDVIDWMLAHDLPPGVIDATYADHILQYYSVVVGDRFKLVHTPTGDAALARGGRVYVIENEDCTRRRYVGLLQGRKEPPLLTIERDGRRIVSLHAIDLPKMADHFTIDPCRSKDQRLKVGHQVGRARNDGWYVRARDKRAYMIYGPYVQNLPSGMYAARFDLILSTKATDDTPVCTLDVYDSASRRELAKRVLNVGDFQDPTTPQTFELQFEATPDASLEFRVYHEGKTSYGCRKIEVAKQ